MGSGCSRENDVAERQALADQVKELKEEIEKLKMANPGKKPADGHRVPHKTPPRHQSPMGNRENSSDHPKQTANRAPKKAISPPGDGKNRVPKDAGGRKSNGAVTATNAGKKHPRRASRTGTLPGTSSSSSLARASRSSHSSHSSHSSRSSRSSHSSHSSDSSDSSGREDSQRRRRGKRRWWMFGSGGDKDEANDKGKATGSTRARVFKDSGGNARKGRESDPNGVRRESRESANPAIRRDAREPAKSRGSVTPPSRSSQRPATASAAGAEKKRSLWGRFFRSSRRSGAGSGSGSDSESESSSDANAGGKRNGGVSRAGRRAGNFLATTTRPSTASGGSRSHLLAPPDDTHVRTSSLWNRALEAAAPGTGLRYGQYIPNSEIERMPPAEKWAALAYRSFKPKPITTDPSWRG